MSDRTAYELAIRQLIDENSVTHLVEWIRRAARHRSTSKERRMPSATDIRDIVYTEIVAPLVEKNQICDARIIDRALVVFNHLMFVHQPNRLKAKLKRENRTDKEVDVKYEELLHEGRAAIRASETFPLIQTDLKNPRGGDADKYKGLAELLTEEKGETSPHLILLAFAIFDLDTRAYKAPTEPTPILEIDSTKKVPASDTDKKLGQMNVSKTILAIGLVLIGLTGFALFHTWQRKDHPAITPRIDSRLLFGTMFKNESSNADSLYIKTLSIKSEDSWRTHEDTLSVNRMWIRLKVVNPTPTIWIADDIFLVQEKPKTVTGTPMDNRIKINQPDPNLGINLHEERDWDLRWQIVHADTEAYLQPHYSTTFLLEIALGESISSSIRTFRLGLTFNNGDTIYHTILSDQPYQLVRP